MAGGQSAVRAISSVVGSRLRHSCQVAGPRTADTHWKAERRSKSGGFGSATGSDSSGFGSSTGSDSSSADATLVVVEATLVVVVVGAVDSRSALVSDVVVDGAIVTVGSGGAVVVDDSAMAVIAPVLVEVGIAASTVVAVEASIVPSVVDPATAVVGDSVTGVVVGAEGTATGPSPPPHAPANREKSAIAQNARTSLIIPRVFQDEEVGVFRI